MSAVVGEFDLGAGWDDLASSDGDMGEIMSMDGDLVSEGEEEGDGDGQGMDDVVIKPGSQESEVKKGEPGMERAQRKYRFHGTFIFVTYAQSKIGDSGEFYERLREKMPVGTLIFGGQERHEDGHPHYHVVMKFPKRIHWSDARSHLRLEGDTDAIKISGLERGQSKESFVEGTQAYCEKDGNPVVFGSRIDADVGKDGDRKRKFREVDEEEDYETSKRMLRELDPYRFIFSYGSVALYLDTEKKRRISGDEVGVGRAGWCSKEWKVPPEMEDWKERNIDSRGPGRANSLVLVGKGKTGKTSWAKSFGRPMVMSKRWNLNNYGEGCSHIVVNDVKPTGFGPSGESYWREVLGCQESFDATDRYCRTMRLQWGIPCVWTCNWDQDPRQYEDIRQYMEDVGVVVVEVHGPLFG